MLWHPAPDDRTPSDYIHDLAGELRGHGIAMEALTPRRLLGPRRIVHIHWPEYVMRPILANAPKRVAKALWGLAVVALLRLRGFPLVYTAHNLAPHDGFESRRERWGYRRILGMADHVVLLSGGHDRLLDDRYPELTGVPKTLIPIGVTRFGPPRPAHPDADGGPVVFVAAGRIAPYKRLVELGTAAETLGAGRIRLDIIGLDKDPDVRVELDRITARTDAVTTEYGYAEADRIHEVLVAGHAAIALQAEAFTSAAALLSLTHGLPVVMSPGPQADFLTDVVGEEWVATLAGDITADKLDDLCRWALAPRSGLPDVSRFEWPAIGDAYNELYATL